MRDRTVNVQYLHSLPHRAAGARRAAKNVGWSTTEATLLYRFLRHSWRWFNQLITAKGWDQYPDETYFPDSEEDMAYHSLQRTLDRETGVVHIKDPVTGTLAICVQGFAASTLDTACKHTAVPTCVFCIAGLAAKLPQWRFLPASTLYRQTVEANLDG